MALCSGNPYINAVANNVNIRLTAGDWLPDIVRHTQDVKVFDTHSR